MIVDETGREVATYGTSRKMAEDAIQRLGNKLGHKYKIIQKGIIEQTSKKLESLKEKAEDAVTEKETQNIVNSIKAVQLKRQSAIINEREKSMSKTFKDSWKGLNKKMVEFVCPNCGYEAEASAVYDEKICPKCGSQMKK